jgi:hypothetical protein
MAGTNPHHPTIDAIFALLPAFSINKAVIRPPALNNVIRS